MAKEGIVGRGVLLDFHSWRLKHQRYPNYDPFETGSIHVEDLKAIAEEQGVSFRTGDILLIRSGFFAKFDETSNEQRAAYAAREGPPRFSGLEQSEGMLEWLWENHFAAVCSSFCTENSVD